MLCQELTLRVAGLHIRGCECAAADVDPKAHILLIVGGMSFDWHPTVPPAPLYSKDVLSEFFHTETLSANTAAVSNLDVLQGLVPASLPPCNTTSTSGALWTPELRMFAITRVFVATGTRLPLVTRTQIVLSVDQLGSLRLYEQVLTAPVFGWEQITLWRVLAGVACLGVGGLSAIRSVRQTIRWLSRLKPLLSSNHGGYTRDSRARVRSYWVWFDWAYQCISLIVLPLLIIWLGHHNPSLHNALGSGEGYTEVGWALNM